MKRITLLVMLVLCGMAGVLLKSVRTVNAQPPSTQPANTIYNPYPPGILPADLVSEIARVRREVITLENEAIAEWHALTLPVLSNTQGVGNPPILQGTGVQAVETLGKLMNYDENISVFRNQACSFCHMPYVAFSGPIPSVNLTMIAYPGSDEFRANKRTAQRYTYSPYFPALQFSTTQGLFFGGNFWDSRATGYLLRSPDPEQAQHPPVDAGEMGFPDTACIAFRLSQAVYRPLFETVWGAGSFNITFPSNTEQICSTPSGASQFTTATPIQLSPIDRTHANDVFNHWGESINAYEHSLAVSAFSSKFDAFLKASAGAPISSNTTLTANELAGFLLFNGKGNCNSCHTDGRGTTLTPGETDTSNSAALHPIFSCFGSANEGLPINAAIAFYYETTPDFFGFTVNPFGFGYRDLGMGTFLRSGFGSSPNPNNTWTQFAPMSDGQFQVATARNAALTPPQCPTTEAGTQPYFQKEFFHNGYIKSLKQLVHFYNTRDKFAQPVFSGHCPQGTTERVDCWPMPEVQGNVDMTTGNLGLTDTEENQVVAFLQTLADGFVTPYPDINSFTGACMTCNPATDPNCSPSRQGNANIVPVPLPLTPCASAICGVAPLPTTTIP
jgi:cytochrome c peroxidase